MKAKEIESKLSNGEKLVIQNNPYFDDKYYIGEEINENRLNKRQFYKYKEMCTNKDETDDNCMGVKGKLTRHYYWL